MSQRHLYRQLQFQINTSFDVAMYDVDLFGELREKQLPAAVCAGLSVSLCPTSKMSLWVGMICSQYAA